MVSIKRICFENKGVIKRVCTLDNLAHINVICGRNNSGKSSILEAFLSKESIQELFLKFTAKELIDTFNHLYKIEKNSGDGFYKQIIYPIIIKLEKYIDLEIILFDNYNGFFDFFNLIATLCDLPKISENQRELFSKHNSYVDSSTIFPSDHTLQSSYDFISKAFGYLTTIQNRFLLIPSKRDPYTEYSLSNSIPKSYNFSKSEDLINYLFYAKNQFLSSSLFEKYTILSHAFSEISGGYKFDISYLSKNEKEQLALHLLFSNENELTKNWYYANKSGIGLRDLLVILSYVILLDYKYILLEEPENHLHADVQRKLLGYLSTLKDKQFFIATHSNVFLDGTFIDRIFHTKIEDGGVTITDTTNKATLLQDLGYSIFDNLVADLIILVEGPTDKPVLEEFLNKMGVWGKYNIKIWFLGGDIMDQQDLKTFSNSSSVLAIVDNDPKSAKHRNRFLRRCADANIPACRLKRYSLENYFTIDALRKIFSTQIPQELTTINPKQKLEEQIGFDCKKRNRYVVKNMSLNDIIGTDLYDFLQRVEEVCLTKLPTSKLTIPLSLSDSIDNL